MLNQVDHLFHFTKNIDSLKKMLTEGFKPSYAIEKLDDKNILVAMVSFSNILLRDVGNAEVIFYGSYAIGFKREWGIDNTINPVVYTYDKGILHKALSQILYSTIFLKVMQTYKSYFKLFSDRGYGPFSKRIQLTNTPKEVMDILDFLTVKYDGNLVEILSNHAKAIYDTNFPILTLTKPYKVTNSEGKEFIAYNDREWRKLYSQLSVVFEGDKEFEDWSKKQKPHFNEDEYRLKFDITEVKAILLDSETELDEIISALKAAYDPNLIDKLIAENSLTIGTKDQLIAKGF